MASFFKKSKCCVCGASSPKHNIDVSVIASNSNGDSVEVSFDSSDGKIYWCQAFPRINPDHFNGMLITDFLKIYSIIDDIDEDIGVTCSECEDETDGTFVDLNGNILTKPVDVLNYITECIDPNFIKF